MARRLLSFFLITAVATTLAGAPKRRAASQPVIDLSTLAGWLIRNAAVLTSTELTPYSYDLDALGSMLGDATVVGLGDGTHGTHEFFTLKLRMIDYLVREQGFDVVAFEGSFPIFERINQYAQGGDGDPRALLKEANVRLFYLFWDVEEMLAVIEWVREYNLHRGSKPAVEIAGFDIYDEQGGVAGVVSYLRQTDPAAAARAETDYACVLQGKRGDGFCQAAAIQVRERLLAQRAAYTATNSIRAYEDAVQHATVVTQYFGGLVAAPRDAEMARNALWVHEHRGTSGKTILWAHQEHVGKAISDVIGGKSMGTLLRESLGERYFAIGSLTGQGTYRYWARDRVTGVFSAATGTVPTPGEGWYESYFHTRGVPAMLVPLRGELPSWLVGPARYNSAGTNGVLPERNESLPAKLDAVVYIETTTPTAPLP